MPVPVSGVSCQPGNLGILFLNLRRSFWTAKHQFDQVHCDGVGRTVEFGGNPWPTCQASAGRKSQRHPIASVEQSVSFAFMRCCCILTACFQLFTTLRLVAAETSSPITASGLALDKRWQGAVFQNKPRVCDPHRMLRLTWPGPESLSSKERRKGLGSGDGQATRIARKVLPTPQGGKRYEVGERMPAGAPLRMVRNPAAHC